MGCGRSPNSEGFPPDPVYTPIDGTSEDVRAVLKGDVVQEIDESKRLEEGPKLILEEHSSVPVAEFVNCYDDKAAEHAVTTYRTKAGEIMVVFCNHRAITTYSRRYASSLDKLRELLQRVVTAVGL
jgi:hypothetical protein